jgi:menaquinone-dependent protoporphyrinogen oxidase
MSILVTYGSKHGGTEGLAEMVADGLRDEGFTVEVVPAHRVKDLEGRDVVIVGGALYAFRWHKDARRFVKRHASELRERRVYFFASGPLDYSAATKDIPPVKGVKKLMERVGAQGHVTFGGCLSPDVKGFPAAAMAKKNAGDWRDADHVRRWVMSIAADLHSVVT